MGKMACPSREMKSIASSQCQLTLIAQAIPPNHDSIFAGFLPFVTDTNTHPGAAGLLDLSLIHI